MKKLCTWYEAEVLAIGRAFHNLATTDLIDFETEEVQVWVDNQLALNYAVLPHGCAAQEFAIAARAAYLAFHLRHSALRLTLHWIAGHEGVEGNERVDKAANDAAKAAERADKDDKEDSRSDSTLTDLAQDKEPEGSLDSHRPRGDEEGAGLLPSPEW